MSYKIQKQGAREWLINDNILVNLKRHNLSTWLKENTNSYDSRCKHTEEEVKLIEYFLNNGFTPLIGCYGNKKYSEKGAKPFCEVNDTISWFLFDGVSDDTTTFPGNYLCSFAVNYDKNKGIFTVYHHDGPMRGNKRIGIYDDIYDVTDLTKDYIPVKIIDRGESSWIIDFSKLNICNVGGNYGLNKGQEYILSDGIDNQIFEERVGNIINNVSKYIIETTDGCYRNIKGLRNEPKSYITTIPNVVDTYGFMVDTEHGGIDKTEGVGFALIFKFIDTNSVNVSLYEKRTKYAMKSCTESINIRRNFNIGESIEDQILSIVKTLGVYFADPNEINNDDCGCKDETEEK